MVKETAYSTLLEQPTLSNKLSGYFDEITAKTMTNIHRLLDLDKKLAIELTKYIYKEDSKVPSYSFNESYFNSSKQVDFIIEDIVSSYTDYRLLPFPKNCGEIFVQLHLDKESPIHIMDKVYSKEDFYNCIIHMKNIINKDTIEKLSSRFKNISRKYTINTIEHLWEKKCIYPYNLLHEVYGNSFVLYQLYDIDYLVNKLHNMFKAREDLAPYLPLVQSFFLHGKIMSEAMERFGLSASEIITKMQLIKHSIHKASFIKELFSSDNFPLVGNIRYNPLDEKRLSDISDRTFLTNLTYGISEQDYNIDRLVIIKKVASI